jgi:acyl dehydratase
MLIRVRDGAAELIEDVDHPIDARWLTAYAAAVGDTSPALFDLDRPGGIVAHPVFPVCLEWPIIERGVVGLDFPEGGAHRGLHVSHEIVLQQPIRVGDVLRTTARLRTAEPNSIGVYALVEFDTVDADGSLVVTTRQGILYLGATLVGGNGRRHTAPSDNEPLAPRTELGSFEVGVGDAAVYTECARIWNPIHTDARVARGTGLPGPILHGTATLARVVSTITEHALDGDPTRIQRLGCRFAKVVLPPTTVTVFVQRHREGLRFEAHTTGGTAAVRAGFLELSP